MKQTAQKLYAYLFELAEEKKMYLYAIIDSAVDGMIDGHFESDEPKKEILYSDPKDQIALELKAPHLILLERNHPFTLRIFEEGIGQNWGCFVLSKEPFDVVATHLKHYTKIYSQEHQQDVYVRFYDPRAIGKYFPLLDQEEAVEFFSKMACIISEIPENEKHIHLYMLDHQSSKIQRVEKRLQEEVLS